MSKVPQQVLRHNGRDVTTPFGYKSVPDYIKVLQLNLKIMKSDPKRYSSARIEEYEAELKSLEV